MKATLCSVIGKLCLLVGVGSIASHLFFGGILTTIPVPVALIVVAGSLFLLWQSAVLRDERRAELGVRLDRTEGGTS